MQQIHDRKFSSNYKNLNHKIEAITQSTQGFCSSENPLSTSKVKSLWDGQIQ
jgi:hypothetical protein